MEFSFGLAFTATPFFDVRGSYARSPLLRRINQAAALAISCDIDSYLPLRMSVSIGKITWEVSIRKSREYFESDEVEKSIARQVESTLSWMRANNGSYTSSGALKSGEGWWNTPSYTDDFVLVETRSGILRDRAYEHGMLHFFLSLQKELEIALSPEVISLITEAVTPGVIRQFRNLNRAEPTGTHSLAKFGDLYGYEPTCRSALYRDNKLVPLCEIGFLTARFNQTYAISIGPVAKAFYVGVFMPIINEMVVNPDQEI